MFNGFGSSVSLDTLSITSMMDTYNTIGSNTKYNAWGSGHENDWWDNQLDRYTNSFNNGGWNSNNFATSILKRKCNASFLYLNKHMLDYRTVPQIIDIIKYSN